MNLSPSYLIVAKCVLNDASVYYVEIDTSINSMKVCLSSGETAGPTNFCMSTGERVTAYEYSLALRFAKTPDEVLAAFKTYGFPNRLVVKILRAEPIGQRLVFTFLPPAEAVVAPLKRTPARRSRVGSGDEPSPASGP